MPRAKRPGASMSNPVEDSQNTPLLFINRTPSNYHKSRKDAAQISSHISARYRKWKRNNERYIALHNTTKAILGPRKRRKVNESSASLAESSDSRSVTACDPSTETPSTEPSTFCSETTSPMLTPLSSIVNARSNTATPAAEDCHIHKHFAQLTSRLHSLAPIAGQSLGTVAYASRLCEDGGMRPPNLLGYYSLDPFSTYGSDIDLEMRSDIHFYFKVIRPFAAHLIDAWWWCDDMPQIQSSRILAYAVAAYSSLFLSGCRRGGPGVVLPPPVSPGQRSRWPNPPWLRLQTICISELNAHLQNNGSLDESCFSAILFLFRVSVLLADGPSARMHAKALKKIGSSIDSKRVALNAELAVTKVNIISAFLHRQSTVVVKHRPTRTKKQLSHVVELDLQHWPLNQSWHGMRAALAGRLLAWREHEPAACVQDRTAAELVRMDANIGRLTSKDQVELQLCYQIGLFLSHILHCISFNTAAPRIRTNAILLKGKLSAMDLDEVAPVCPNLLFNLLFCGAIACHSYIERLWFIARLSMYFSDIRYMEDVNAQIAVFIDPLNWVTELVEEVLLEVLRLRSASRNPTQKFVLWRKDRSRGMAGDPWATRTPIVSTSRALGQDSEDFDVDPEF